jgi:hypothetical protein
VAHASTHRRFTGATSTEVEGFAGLVKIQIPNLDLTSKRQSYCPGLPLSIEQVLFQIISKRWPGRVCVKWGQNHIENISSDVPKEVSLFLGQEGDLCCALSVCHDDAGVLCYHRWVSHIFPVTISPVDF